MSTTFKFKAELRKERGLASKIAKELGVTPSAVWQWEQVPPRHVVKIGEFLRVARHRIRPDIYPSG
jgi:DNA-binding transcriptional regulator YdaS (Cro superfamily)